ncbi:MAG: hypothetical protein J1F02_06245 [Lachnospiraceae bacterium]|nr:hypothetical protein [Lachnospiraceae bacterium]
MEEKDNKKTGRRNGKKIILFVGILLVLGILCILIRKVIEPFDINEDEVARISISCHWSMEEYHADLARGEEMRDAIKVINSIRAFGGDDTLVEYIGGDSPDAMVHFYDENGDECHFMNFYGNIILYDDTYYKIIGNEERQYNKLETLCEKYEETEETISDDESAEPTQDNIEDEYDDEYFVEKYSVYSNPIDEYFWPEIYSWEASQVEIRAAQDAYKKVWKAEFKSVMKWLKKKCIYDEDKKNIQALEKSVARQIKTERKVCETEMTDAYGTKPDPAKAADGVSRISLWGNGTRSGLNKIEGEIYRDAAMKIIHLYGGVGDETYEFRKVDYAAIIEKEKW